MYEKMLKDYHFQNFHNQTITILGYIYPNYSISQNNLFNSFSNHNKKESPTPYRALYLLNLFQT